jgi:hypothetical protein
MEKMGSSGFEPLKAKSQQIYSLSPLAARATPRVGRVCLIPAEHALAHEAQVHEINSSYFKSAGGD